MAKRKPKTLGGWRDDANCLSIEGLPTSRERNALFFPERSQVEAARAKEVCKTCPVKQQCLDEAIANREKHGIWGGLDTSERGREVRRRRNQVRRIT